MRSNTRARRLQKFGRVELLQILDDQPPYWFVTIRNFNPKPDVAPGLIDPVKGNVWRFLDLERAEARLEELSALPWCLADEARVQKTRLLAKPRILAAGLTLAEEVKIRDGVILGFYG
jgi:hypothetical protein